MCEQITPACYLSDLATGQQERKHNDNCASIVEVYNQSSIWNRLDAMDMRVVPTKLRGRGPSFRSTNTRTWTRRQCRRSSAGLFVGFDAMGRGAFSLFRPINSDGCGIFLLSGIGCFGQWLDSHTFLRRLPLGRRLRIQLRRRSGVLWLNRLQEGYGC